MTFQQEFLRQRDEGEQNFGFQASKGESSDFRAILFPQSQSRIPAWPLSMDWVNLWCSAFVSLQNMLQTLARCKALFPEFLGQLEAH